jgi:hypothetical protein
VARTIFTSHLRGPEVQGPRLSAGRAVRCR